MKPKWTEEENEKIKKYYLNAGKRYLCELFPDRKGHSIRCQAWKLGIIKTFRHSKWKEEEVEILKNNFFIKNKEELSKLLPNRSRKSVRIQANLLGMKLQEPGNHSDLSTLLEEKPEAYYWMGFLLADGCFMDNIIEIGAHPQDASHIQKYANYIKYIKELKILSSEEGGVRVKSSDNKIAPLIKKKFHINYSKTYNPPNLKHIKNKDFLLCLIMGYIDGDGCISSYYTKGEGNKSHIRIHVHRSWLDILKYFHSFLYEYSGIKIKDSDNKKSSRPEYTKDGALFCLSDNDVIAFMKKRALKLNIPLMERKWDKVDENYMSKELKEQKEFWPKIEIYLKKGINKISISRELKISTRVLGRLLNDMKRNKLI